MTTVAEVDAVRQSGLWTLGVRRSPQDIHAWGLDPHVGTHWPGRGETEPPPGVDPRTIWELSRLQHLPWMAQTGRAIDANEAWAGFESWWAEHPPGPGWAWTEGLELACRVVSLVRLGAEVGPERTAAERERLRDCMAAHGYFIEQFPSRYSSSNNHRIGQLCALLVLGHCTDLPAAARWRQQPLTELVSCVQMQIGPDGTGAEQSVGYLAFVLEWLLLADVVSGGLGEEIRSRMVAAAVFLGAVSGDWGALNFGDSDGGRVLWSAEREPGYVRSVLGAVASRLERADLCPGGWTPDARAKSLGLAPIQGTLVQTSQTFPSGGWTHLVSPRARVWLDHGPMGLPPMCIHGHADALSTLWNLDGREMWVDAGTLRYVGRPGWRQWLRGVRAHNTVRVGARDPVRPTSPFLWEGVWQGRADGIALARDGGSVMGEADHEAGVHRRRVVLEPGCLTLMDQLRGHGEHRISVGFLWHPRLRVRRVREGFSVLDGRRRVALMHVDPRLEWSLHRQAGGVGFGAWSPEYGVLEDTTQLVGEGRLVLNTEVVTRVSW